MLLETRLASVTAPDADLSEMGYDNIDGMNLPVTSILSTQGTIDLTIINPVALITAKSLWSFGCYECNRVNKI